MRASNAGAARRPGIRAMSMPGTPTVPPLLRYAYYLLIVLAVLWPRYFFLPVAGVGLNPYTLGSLLAALTAFALLLTTPSLARAWARAVAANLPLVSLVIGFLLWRWICALFGEYPLLSLRIVSRDMIYVVAHVFIASVFFLDARCRRAVVPLLCIAALFAGTIGILERLTETSITDRLGLYYLAAGDADQVRIIVDNKFRDGAFRAQSLFAHPIVYGQFMAAMIPLALVYGAGARGLGHAVAPALILVILLSIFASSTRSPIIVVIVSTVAWVVLANLSGRRFDPARLALFAALGFVGLAVLAAVGDEILGLLAGRSATEISSSEARDDMIATGLSATLASPIFGYGDGTGAIKAGLVGANGVLTIDNLYLSVLVETGFVGILLFVAMLAATIVSGIRRLRSADTQRVRLAAGFTAMASALAVGQYVLSIGDNLTFIYMSAGLIVALSAVPEPSSTARTVISARARPTPPPRPIPQRARSA